MFVSLAGANRDPTKFPRPNELNMARNPASNHLAFGHGIHYCIGAPLARLEAQIAFVELSKRFPRLTLAGPIDELDWVPGLIMHGLRGLPVSFSGSTSREPDAAPSQNRGGAQSVTPTLPVRRRS